MLSLNELLYIKLVKVENFSSDSFEFVLTLISSKFIVFQRDSKFCSVS